MSKKKHGKQKRSRKNEKRKGFPKWIFILVASLIGLGVILIYQKGKIQPGSVTSREVIEKSQSLPPVGSSEWKKLLSRKHNRQARVQLINRYIEGAKKVANLTKDPHALNLIKLTSLGVVAAPSGRGFVVLDAGKGPDWFYLIGLLPEDRFVDHFWNKEYESPRVSTFYDRQNFLVVHGKGRISPTFIGLIFLHELNHVKQFHQKANKGRTVLEVKKRVILHEYETYKWELKLLGQVGGKKFQEFLIFETDKHAAGLKDHLYWNKLKRPDEFDRFFEESLSENESQVRNGIYALALYFSYFDKAYGQDSEKAAIEFLEKIHDPIARY